MNRNITVENCKVSVKKVWFYFQDQRQNENLSHLFRITIGKYSVFGITRLKLGPKEIQNTLKLHCGYFSELWQKHEEDHSGPHTESLVRFVAAVLPVAVSLSLVCGLKLYVIPAAKCY